MVKAELDELMRAEGDNFKVSLLRSLFMYWEEAEKALLEGRVSVNKILEGDRTELDRLLNNTVKGVYKNILICLETGLAEHPELYEKMRTRVLRIGNDAIRQLEQETKNYHTLKITDSETVVVYDVERDRVNV